MSENLQELCCSLVEDFFGEFHCRLYAQLAYHGRLSASQLAQRLQQPIRSIKFGLATLVQSQMIYHHTTTEGISTYQADIKSSYNILRIGRLIELARTQLGNLAADLVAHAALLGFATFAELEVKALQHSFTKQPPLSNGACNETISLTPQLQTIRANVHKLIDHGYLTYVRAAHFQTPFDAIQDVQNHLKVSGTVATMKGKKGVQELDEKVDSEYYNRISILNREYGYVPAPSQHGDYSFNDVDAPVTKRQKMNTSRKEKPNGLTTGTLAQGHEDSRTLLCVSVDNVIADIRDSRLSYKARKTLGDVYSQIIRAALSQIPTTSRWTKETDQYELNINDIRDKINQSTTGTLPNGHQPYESVRENSVHDTEDSEEFKRNLSYLEAESALQYLANGRFPFLEGADRAWTLDKREMDKYLQQQEIARMMGDQLGPPALRIVRMLKDKGKLDEKTLQEVGLLGAKELRQTLAELKQMGYIDLQEVPREAQRQPNRTIFLWFHDSDRVQKVLLNNTYKAIAGLMQKLKSERNKLSSTLEKIERIDVQGNEEQVMSVAELRVLRRWQRTEHWLVGEIMRLDESVALLRDL